MNSQAESLINLIKQKKNNAVRPKNIFAFTSGKGGTGKTFVSLNLAVFLSQKNYKVLFIDFDSNLANADVLLNKSADGTIIEFFKGEKRLKNIITKVSPKFYCIFGDSGLTDYPKLTVSMIELFLNNINALTEEFDFIFIDTGAGLNQEMLHLLNEVENIVLVINPEPTTIIDAYAVLKMTVDSFGRKLIIVNSIYSEEEGENAFYNLLKASLHFLKTEIIKIGFISFDTKIRQSIYEQKLFVNHFKNSIVYQQIENISINLLELNQLANINHSL